ncbi:unnamed protein product, partial [Mesorhabditis spiculigera]
MWRIEVFSSVPAITRCTGSIMNKDTVLTAAQCVQGVPQSELKIIAGVADIRAHSLHNVSGQQREIARIWVHDDFKSVESTWPNPLNPKDVYSAKFHVNDVALLILKNPLERVADEVWPVIVPDPKAPLDATGAYEAMLLGWGLTREDNGSHIGSRDLRSVGVSLALPSGSTECVGEEYNEQVLCSQDGERAIPCWGDLGAPAVVSMAAKQPPGMKFNVLVAMATNYDGECDGSGTNRIYTDTDDLLDHRPGKHRASAEQLRAAQRLFVKLMAEYEESSTPFIDSDFAPSASSLGDLNRYYPRDKPEWREKYEDSLKQAVWRRPEDRIPCKEGEKWALFDNPSPLDVLQGRLSDCWLLAVLCTMAKQPELIDDIFITKQYNPAGIYQLHHWPRAIIDRLLRAKPCPPGTYWISYDFLYTLVHWVRVVPYPSAEDFDSEATWSVLRVPLWIGGAFDDRDKWEDLLLCVHRVNGDGTVGRLAAYSKWKSDEAVNIGETKLKKGLYVIIAHSLGLVGVVGKKRRAALVVHCHGIDVSVLTGIYRDALAAKSTTVKECDNFFRHVCPRDSKKLTLIRQLKKIEDALAADGWRDTVKEYPHWEKFVERNPAFSQYLPAVKRHIGLLRARVEHPFFRSFDYSRVTGKPPTLFGSFFASFDDVMAEFMVDPEQEPKKWAEMATEDEDNELLWFFDNTASEAQWIKYRTKVTALATDLENIDKLIETYGEYLTAFGMDREVRERREVRDAHARKAAELASEYYFEDFMKGQHLRTPPPVLYMAMAMIAARHSALGRCYNSSGDPGLHSLLMARLAFDLGANNVDDWQIDVGSELGLYGNDLFFRAAALTYCDKFSDVQASPNGPRLAHYAAVNGAIMPSAVFQKTYKCSLGLSMFQYNVDDTCSPFH